MQQSPKAQTKPLSQQTQRYHEFLLSPDGERGRKYLKSRGICDIDIKLFKIGYANEGYFADRVTFPVYGKDGEIHNITSRLVSKDKTAKSHLHLPHIKQDWFFNERVLALPMKELVIVESPIDCITLARIGLNSVAAMGANNVNKGKIAKIPSVDRIYVCFDNDINEAGDKAAYRVGQLVYITLKQKAKKITIPFLKGPDVNAMSVKSPENFAKEFYSLMGAASTVTPKEIKKRKKGNGDLGDIKFDIIKLAEQYVELRPAGRGAYKAICPIHEETEPSFYVNENTNRWICFGHGEGGDAIDLLRAIEKSRGKDISFREAVNILRKI